MATSRRLLATGNILNTSSTLQCGQCFRWSSGSESNTFTGIVEGRPAIISQEKNSDVYIQTDGSLDFWRDYFDLETDYEKITKQFTAKSSAHPFICEAIKKWRGMRVLRQYPWETLCSYIVSQQNNIPRIRTTIKKLCEHFGNEVTFLGEKFYTFPTPNILASVKPEDLRQFGVGYRDKYIAAVAKKVADGEVDFDQLRELSTSNARTELLKLYGVGKKVADCVLLYGLGKLDAFPVDTWIKQAVETHGFSASDFGEYAGIAQLYIFQHYRAQ